MKRLMLTTAATLALSTTAFAQTAVESTVMRALENYGYAPMAIEQLTDAEINQLYLAASSDNTDDIQAMIAGFDLDESAMMAEPAAVAIVMDDATGSPDVNATVGRILNSYGYDAAMVDMLSDDEIAEIYLAGTSEDGGDLQDILAGLENGSMAQLNTAGTSDAEVAVTDYLMDQGYDAAAIAQVEGAELAAIYIALNSGDRTEVRRLVESAIDS